MRFHRPIASRGAIAADQGDARVGGLMEVLEALRTGVEMRFPSARAFVLRGLDEGQGVPTTLEPLTH